MNGLKPLIEKLSERQQRGPVSIAFFLTKRGVFQSLEEAHEAALIHTPRPHFEGLLWRTQHDTLGP
jgi:hypothetical protein